LGIMRRISSTFRSWGRDCFFLGGERWGGPIPGKKQTDGGLLSRVLPFRQDPVPGEEETVPTPSARSVRSNPTNDGAKPKIKNLSG
jgi:hypothetical protein